MCVVSNIGDYYGKRFPEWPTFDPWKTHPELPVSPVVPSIIPRQSPEEIAEAMRRFRELIKAGEQADKAAGEKDCEKTEVKEYIQQVLTRLDQIEKRLRQLEGLE